MILRGEVAPHPAPFTVHVVMGQSVVYVCEKMSVQPFATAILEPAELYGIDGFMNEASTREFEQSRGSAVTVIESF